MNRALFLALLLLAAPLLAVTGDCDPQLQHLAALYQVRSLMMRGSTYDVDRFIDAQLEELREPLGNGAYRWVRWVRPSGEGPVEKKTRNVIAVQGAGDADAFEAGRDHTYAVKVVVPRKRSLLNANNPVYVGNVSVRYTVNGRSKTIERPVNAWMNPDTSRTIDLETIADRVEVALEASTSQRNSNQSVVEIHFQEAVAQDDPANPNYGTIQALKRIGSSTDDATVDGEIAALERSLFPGSTPLPLLTILDDLREADKLIRSEKPEEQERGQRRLREALRRLR